MELEAANIVENKTIAKTCFTAYTSLTQIDGQASIVQARNGRNKQGVRYDSSPLRKFLWRDVWLEERSGPQEFKPEAQAKELAGIALESSFACASGSYRWLI
jgi:hypothetical protein